MLVLDKISYSVAEKIGSKTEKKEIIKNLSLKINDGEFVVITGPNGSGKSTLTKLIMGIVKPTSGKIIFDGKDITNISVSERAKLGIGFAFQQPIKFKGLTALDLLNISAGKKLSVTEACEYLSDVGLCAREYIDRNVDDSLSGGEQKRIEIAEVVAKKSKLSIFDEPEAGIDLWSFERLTNLFKKMASKNKGTTLIVSHQEKLIQMADKVVLMDGGKIKEIGAPKDVLNKIKTKTISCLKVDKNV